MGSCTELSLCPCPVVPRVKGFNIADGSAEINGPKEQVWASALELPTYEVSSIDISESNAPDMH
jgi:hypothetical protein